jgi:hypothetical protein
MVQTRQAISSCSCRTLSALQATAAYQDVPGTGWPTTRQSMVPEMAGNTMSRGLMS